MKGKIEQIKELAREKNIPIVKAKDLLEEIWKKGKKYKLEKISREKNNLFFFKIKNILFVIIIFYIGWNFTELWELLNNLI